MKFCQIGPTFWISGKTVNFFWVKLFATSSLGKPPDKKNGKKRGHCPHVGGGQPQFPFFAQIYRNLPDPPIAQKLTLDTLEIQFLSYFFVIFRPFRIFWRCHSLKMCDILNGIVAVFLEANFWCSCDTFFWHLIPNRDYTTKRSLKKRYKIHFSIVTSLFLKVD